MCMIVKVRNKKRFSKNDTKSISSRLLQTLSEKKADKKNEKAEKLFEEADILFKGNDIDRENALQLLKENEEEYSENPDFLWRLAKAHQMQATKHGALNNKEKKKEYITKGTFLV